MARWKTGIVRSNEHSAQSYPNDSILWRRAVSDDVAKESVLGSR